MKPRRNLNLTEELEDLIANSSLFDVLVALSLVVHEEGLIKRHDGAARKDYEAWLSSSRIIETAVRNIEPKGI